MTDLALIWSDEAFAADLALLDGDLAKDGGLKTAVILSLFTDARARPDDVLPQEGADRRGWWPDALGADEDRMGSRLWLLAREKLTPDTVARAREYAEEALMWLVRDGVARELVVTVEVVGPAALGLHILIGRGDGPDRERFDFVWKGL
ncbi:phage GP46 family protein [Brevundimonas sp.]|uniref:phage GP46 family protein n=1 Tax=Brevundimonas sp. TaxID=1871086 RepID=UPI003F6E6CA9